jgi:outer membrane immunogenic protein
MKRFLLASVGVAAMAGLMGTASAADLPRQAPVYKAPAYVAPVSNWTGFYLGINGGGAWGSSQWTGLGTDFDVSGGLIGGTIGYNWQAGNWVFGLEGDADWANIKGSTNIGGIDFRTKNDFLATARGRIGYTFDRAMLYGTGGAAIGSVKASVPGFGSASETNVGWTAGAGLEYAFAPNWSAKVEYLYVDLGNVDCGGACGFAGSNKVDFTTNVVRGGVNFRF